MDHQTISEELLSRYFAGRCTGEEKTHVRNFLASLDAEAMHALLEQEWQRMEQEPPTRDKGRARRHYGKIKAATRPLPVSASQHLLIYRIAASLAMIAVCAFAALYILKTEVFFPPSARMLQASTLTGRLQQVRLPDGSDVWLNAASRIRFPERFGDSREVALEGEAFFSVKKDPDKPFIIRTGDFYTTVLGTSFNVKAYKEDKHIEVTVSSGKVSVSVADDTVYGHAVRLALLTPDKQLRYSPTTRSFTTTTVDATDAKSWISGQLVFRKASVQEVAGVLERRFGKEVRVVGFVPGKTCTFTGDFRKGTPLSDILETLSITERLDYKIYDRRVVIDVRKCLKKQNDVKQ